MPVLLRLRQTRLVHDINVVIMTTCIDRSVITGPHRYVTMCPYRYVVTCIYRDRSRVRSSSSSSSRSLTIKKHVDGDVDIVVVLDQKEPERFVWWASERISKLEEAKPVLCFRPCDLFVRLRGGGEWHGERVGGREPEGGNVPQLDGS